jgi:glycogen operon protein
VLPVRIHAPRATNLELIEFDGDEPALRSPLKRDGDDWVGEVAEGTIYGLVADGSGPRCDPAKVLLDPRATAVHFPAGHDRVAASIPGVVTVGRSPLAIARRDPAPRPPRRTTRAPVVCEVHVDAVTRRAGGADPGTFRALVEQLPRLHGLGVTVLELMPVHQTDPQEGSYWGYMPLAFGAVDQRYGAGDDAAAELAELVAAAHDLDVEVWLDVVFNHTTEVGAGGPTYSLRGLADDTYYRLDEDGSYIQTSGCGNDLDIRSPAAAELVVWALDRLADLGVDGFRFDLAPVLSHDPAFIRRLDDWAAARDVRLIAEPWDAAGRHQLGPTWPGRHWRQWNDRFRDDVRSFLRGEPGYVARLQQRIQGSPDLFESPLHSVNFVACHDGFTLYDVVAYDRKHNRANGEHNCDGSNHNRSWNCGWEGDVGVPAEVMALRQRQLRNAWCLLLLSHGTPMWTAGDECGRTQGGNNNAYNQDNETSWFDWERRREFLDLERFVGELLALRAGQAVFADEGFWWDAISWHGADGPPDLGPHSRSLAWQVGDLYVMANSWWEPVRFHIQQRGPWARVVDTNLPAPEDVIGLDAARATAPVYHYYDVGPRSVVVLHRA